MKTQKTKSVFSRVDSSKTLLEGLFDNTLAQLAAFIAFIVITVLLVTLDVNDREQFLKSLEPGQVAAQDIIATRAFVFAQLDEVESAKRRESAANEVPVVFDWEESQGETVRNRVRESFSQMRTGLADTVRKTLEQNDPKRLEALMANAPEDTNDLLISTLSPQRRVSLSNEMRKDVFDRALGVSIRDSDFDAFARSGFSNEAEVATADIVADLMTNIIVPTQRVLDAEGERGIFLRRRRGDQLLVEYHVKDIQARFITMERVPALVEESSARRVSSIGDRELRNAVSSTASALVQPNTFFNQDATVAKRESARQSVADVVVREEFREGQVLAKKGETLTARDIRVVEMMLSEKETLRNTQTFAGTVLICVLMLVTLYLFGRRNIRKFRPERRDIVFMAVSLIVLLIIARFGAWLSHAIADQLEGLPAEAWYYGIPVATAGMLIRLVLNSEHAVVFTVFFAVLCGVMADNSLFFMSYVIIGGLVGAGAAKQVKNRMAMMWSGVVVGLVNVVAILAFLGLQGELLRLSTLGYSMVGFFSGVLSGFIVSATLPLVEAAFGYTTDIKLLELANLNHPALRELIMRAPGSYHHSMMVGSLCEAAAEAIGCNPLLSRVGAYYHDIGKAKNPGYFAENQKLGQNPHDKLKPNMSALIIKAHVKDGLEMGRQYRLPDVILDFIAQHHGTSLIAYFYYKAKQLEDPDIPEVKEKDYRYPGPKPQTRETAICLLADGIEAASRAMPNPTHAKLKGLVQKMINKAFTDGQLDECELTLKDLNQIAEAFHRILTGIYHHRPEYPTDKKNDKQAPPTTETKRIPVRKNGKDGEESDTVSDVWELTEKRAELESKDDDAGGDKRDGGGDGAPPAAKPGKQDSDEGRESLPRLGSN